jgi:hypothetical protein
MLIARDFASVQKIETGDRFDALSGETIPF